MTDSLVDLHMHTTYSDGRLSPEELVRLLQRQGVRVAAITDHDSVDGLGRAFKEAELIPELTLVSGVEISADHPEQPGSDVHILGYFVDTDDDAFQAQLSALRNERHNRASEMVNRLRGYGYQIEMTRVEEIAGDAGIGRPHVARALVEKGYIGTVREAFQGLLDEGGIAYSNRPHISMPSAVDLIKRAGGAAVLAHPLYAQKHERLIELAADAGMAGIEVHYASFTSAQRRSLNRLAETRGLLSLGGSDYHGIGYEDEYQPGSAGPSIDAVTELSKLSGRKG